MAIQALDRFSRLVGQFELDRLRRLLRHDRCPGNYPTAMRDIAYLEFDEIAAPKLAVDGQIEKGKGRLVEPFCGGLAVVTGLMPEKAFLNDINPHVIIYRWTKRGIPIWFEMKNDKTRYYECRDRFNELLKSDKAKTAEAAALFYYRNRTGYNGLCRFNSKDCLNAPFGSYANVRYKTDFSEYKYALAGWVFTNTDFEKIPVEEDDFIYADPPYDVEFTHYSKDGFGWEDQQRAAEWLSKHKGPVVLSNQATPRIVKLYRSLKFSFKFLDAPRSISCTGDRSPAAEVLAVRNIK